MTRYYVDSVHGNDTTGDGTSGTPYQTFDKAYTTPGVTSGDIIDLSGTFDWSADPGTTATGYTVAQGITITGQSGAPAVIDCKGDRKFVTVSPSRDMSFENLEIKNCRGSYDFVISPGSSSLYINKCWIHDCSSNLGNSSSAKLLSIVGKTVIENTTFNSNAAYYSIIYGGTLTLTNCTFYQNVVTYNMLYISTRIFTGCTMYNNTGVAIRAQGGASYIKNCIITGNTTNISESNEATNYTSYNLVASTGNPSPFVNDVSGNIVISSPSNFGTFGLNSSVTGIPTVAILAGNEGIGAGEGTVSNNGISMPTVDARGLARVTNDYDIGAYAYTYTDPITEVPVLILDGSSTIILTLNEAMTPITVSADGGTVTTWSITPSLVPGLTQSSSTGAISGTPTALDILGKTYTISGENVIGTDGVSVTISVHDPYVSNLYTTGLALVDVSAVAEIAIDGSNAIDVSGYLPDDDAVAVKRTKRRALANLIMSRSSNSGFNYFTSTRSGLRLPSKYSKDNIRVYRSSGQTINLADLSADEGAYSPIYDSGDVVTFTNVGGDGTAVFYANGNGSYDISYNGDDYGSVSDGDDIVINGTAFYIGSVGTEGTGGDTICFAAGSMVETDQGLVDIALLDKGYKVQQGDGSYLQVRTKTRVINMCPYLVKIDKDALGPGLPNMSTTVTPEHKIQIKVDTDPATDAHRWYTAEELLQSEGVQRYYPLDDLYVYHVILEDRYGTMIVNGLTAETLPETNINALMRRSDMRINLSDKVLEIMH